MTYNAEGKSRYQTEKSDINFKPSKVEILLFSA